MSAPIVSVVIPTYNRAAELKRCLDSLVAQTTDDFEVLVCDDGSTDDTVEVVGGFADRLNLRFLPSARWGGPARPRNLGIENAAGEWIAFLDSDDWWHPAKLEVCRQQLSANDVVYHRIEVATPGTPAMTGRLIGREVAHPVLIDLLTNLNAIPNSASLVRRNLVREAGGLTEDRRFIAVEDYDLWIRLAQRTERFHYVQHVLGVYWEAGADQNISASQEQIAREMRVFERYRPLLSESQCREAERNWTVRHAGMRSRSSTNASAAVKPADTPR